MQADATTGYAGHMRTTIDLQPELHRMALSIARDERRTLSETINKLLELVLLPQQVHTIATDPISGLPTISLGRVTTDEDVRQLEDDE